MKFPRFSALTALLQRFRVHRAEWTSSDLIDFESYLDADEAQLREHPAARKTLAQRDRVLYIEQIAPEVTPATAQPHTIAHRRLSLRRWLTARRNAEDPQLMPLLPGAAFATAEQLGKLALAATGFLVGIGVASALLSYDGHRPISVPAYVFWLVLVQILFAGIAVWIWTLRSLRRDDEVRGNAWLLMQVIRPLLTRAAQWLQHQRLNHASADIRERALATQGLLKSQFTIYGSVAYFPLLIPAQLFGVAFNLGVIVTTIFLEWFTDLAFGWGSANIHPQTIHDLAQLIAIPWSGLFGEGVGYPTLAQITGSQIHLEQWASGALAFHPDPEHLRSWRWFLVLAVVTYGLFPRLILLGLSVLMQRLALARLTFTHGRTQALYARMLTPIVDTSATVMTPGSEMPIPAPLLPYSRRSGLVGPLAGEKPLPSVRPWREKPVEKSTQPPFAKGGLSDSPPLEKGGAGGIDAIPAVAPEPIIELKAAPEPVIEIAPEPIVEIEPAIEPEPVIELKAAPELPVEKSPQPPFAKGGLSDSPPLEKKGAGGIDAIPAIEPEPIVELKAAPEPVIEIAPEPIVEIEPAVEPEPIIELTTAPELPVEKSPQPPFAKGGLSDSPPLEKKGAGGIDAIPAIEPEPIVELKAAPEPVIEIAPEPIFEIEPAIEPEPIVELTTAPELPIEKSTPLPFAKGGLSDSPPLEKGGTGGIDAIPAIAPEPIVELSPAPPASEEATHFPPDACLLLVHVDVDDVLEPEDRPRLTQLLLQLTGWQAATYATFGAGSAMTARVLDILERGQWQAPPPRIAVIQDGSQPPITENLLFLRELRAAAGAQAQMLLALIGDPEDDDRLPPLRAFDYTDWQRKLDQMADPYLRLEMLAPPSDDGED